MIAQNSEVYNPLHIFFHYMYTYMEKDLCRGVVYFTVLCDHPYLVSLITFCRSGIPTSCYIFNVFFIQFTIMMNCNYTSIYLHAFAAQDERHTCTAIVPNLTRLAVNLRWAALNKPYQNLLVLNTYRTVHALINNKHIELVAYLFMNSTYLNSVPVIILTMKCYCR